MNNKKKIALSTVVTVGVLGGTVSVTNNINNAKMDKQLHELKLETQNLSKKYEKKIDEILKDSNIDKEKIIQLEKQNKTLQKQLNEHERKISFNPHDLTKPSNVSIKQLKKAFKGTEMAGLEQGFVDSERKFGVNAIFLASLVATESGWNNSKRAKDGSNNITGHAVYTDASRGSTFDSKYECILSTGELLGNHYLKDKGEHYNGVSLWNVNQKYSLLPNKKVNYEWSKMINSISNDLVKKINN